MTTWIYLAAGAVMLGACADLAERWLALREARRQWARDLETWGRR